jgi:preprotein translocase subunit YajC
MGKWPYIIGGIIYIIIALMTWPRDKKRKKQKKLDAQVDGMKKGDAQSALEAFDD